MADFEGNEKLFIDLTEAHPSVAESVHGLLRTLEVPFATEAEYWQQLGAGLTETETVIEPVLPAMDEYEVNLDSPHLRIIEVDGQQVPVVDPGMVKQFWFEELERPKNALSGAGQSINSRARDIAKRAGETLPYVAEELDMEYGDAPRAISYVPGIFVEVKDKIADGHLDRNAADVAFDPETEELVQASYADARRVSGKGLTFLVEPTALLAEMHASEAAGEPVDQPIWREHLVHYLEYIRVGGEVTGK